MHRLSGALHMNIVIPMAGAGSRFAKNGYTVPKPFIDVNGKPMIQVAIESLNVAGRYIFVVRSEHVNQYSLIELLHECCDDPIIISINELTEGPASSVLLAKQYINNKSPLLIANCDQYLEWNSEDFLDKMKDVDGGVLTYKDNDLKSSYVRIDDAGYITEAVEKKVISDDATVGIYYWSHGSDFVKYARSMIKKNIRTNGEFYNCPVYNEAIADNKKFRTYDVTGKSWLIGTPKDLDMFLRHKIINDKVCSI